MISNWDILASFLHGTLVAALAWLLVGGIVLAGALLRETSNRDSENNKDPQEKKS